MQPAPQHSVTSSRQVSIRAESERQIGAGCVCEERKRLFFESMVPAVVLSETVPRMVVRIGIVEEFSRRFLRGGWGVEV